MKHFSKPQLLMFLLVVLASCSGPTMEEAVEAYDRNAIGKILRSGAYDPNLRVGEESLPLVEWMLRRTNSTDYVELVAEHPDLSLESRNLALKNLFDDIGGGSSEEWYIQNGNDKAKFSHFNKAIFTMAKEVPDDKASVMKYTLDDETLAIYDGTTFHVLRGADWISVGTDNVLDVLSPPEYVEVVPSSAGKELVLYVLHPAGMNPKSYVEVFSDPFASLGMEFSWEDKLLFSAIYPYGYKFDGSMEFPENLEIVSSKIEGSVSYESYLAWIENNLHSFGWSGADDRPQKVPQRFQTFTNFDNMAPKAIEKNVGESGYDLILFESVFDYGEPTLTLTLAVYADEKLLNTINLAESGEYMYTPSPQVNLENGKLKVFREGYNTADALTDVAPDDFVAEDLPDTTYFYTITETGELMASNATLPAIAGVYDGFRMYVAIDGDQITGYYDNGRYEGNPNFGCSFLFYGKTTDLIENRKINIQTLNPFDLSDDPRGGGFMRLHSEENNLFTMVAKLNGTDCWDRNLGFAQIGQDPGVSFELDEERPYKEIRIATEEIPVYDETEALTQLKVEKDGVVIVLEEFETAFSVIFFTGNGPTEGYINKGKTRALMP